MHQRLLECKCALCEESLRQPWRRTFSWPQRSSGKLFGAQERKSELGPGGVHPEKGMTDQETVEGWKKHFEKLWKTTHPLEGSKA